MEKTKTQIRKSTIQLWVERLLIGLLLLAIALMALQLLGCGALDDFCVNEAGDQHWEYVTHEIKSSDCDLSTMLEPRVGLFFELKDKPLYLNVPSESFCGQTKHVYSYYHVNGDNGTNLTVDYNISEQGLEGSIQDTPFSSTNSLCSRPSGTIHPSGCIGLEGAVEVTSQKCQFHYYLWFRRVD